MIEGKVVHSILTERHFCQQLIKSHAKPQGDKKIKIIKAIKKWQKIPQHPDDFFAKIDANHRHP